MPPKKPQAPPPIPLVLHGRVVTFSGHSKGAVIDDGAVYIGADERLKAVQARGEDPPGGFEDAPRIDTGGAIYPGLLDLHNHVAYNCLSLWASPTREEPWERRDQWPDDPSYKPKVSLPTAALCHVAGEAVLKYVETKAVIGGTTAIQGSAKVPHYQGWLVRNVEKETFKGEKKTPRQSVREITKLGGFDSYRRAMDDGRGFIYHLSEGTAAELIEEYDLLREARCLKPRLLAVHSTALGDEQFERWGDPKRSHGSVVWSPFSNLWLYGKTTDVWKAAKEGIRICLGADWSPSGSKNVLGELKVADLVNKARKARRFTDEELCRMVTSNPADALGWEDRLGRLEPGLHADVLVTSDRGGDPYRNLIEATERDVLFVAINGYPLYSTSELMDKAKAEHAEPIQIGDMRRRIVLVYPGVPNADLRWQEVKRELDSARTDPKRHERRRKGKRPRGEPVRMRPEKPFDANLKVDEPTLETVAIPRPDPLVHAEAFFRVVKGRGFHSGLLDGLRTYYQRTNRDDHEDAPPIGPTP
jgi:5-methylthioadenosine/S-adenosylhomocysteine deaminase